MVPLATRLCSLFLIFNLFVIFELLPDNAAAEEPLYCNVTEASADPSIDPRMCSICPPSTVLPWGTAQDQSEMMNCPPPLQQCIDFVIPPALQDQFPGYTLPTAGVPGGGGGSCGCDCFVCWMIEETVIQGDMLPLVIRVPKLEGPACMGDTCPPPWSSIGMSLPCNDSGGCTSEGDPDDNESDPWDDDNQDGLPDGFQLEINGQFNPNIFVLPADLDFLSELMADTAFGAAFGPLLQKYLNAPGGTEALYDMLDPDGDGVTTMAVLVGATATMLEQSAGGFFAEFQKGLSFTPNMTLNDYNDWLSGQTESAEWYIKAFFAFGQMISDFANAGAPQYEESFGDFVNGDLAALGEVIQGIINAAAQQLTLIGAELEAIAELEAVVAHPETFVTSTLTLTTTPDPLSGNIHSFLPSPDEAEYQTAPDPDDPNQPGGEPIAGLEPTTPRVPTEISSLAGDPVDTGTGAMIHHEHLLAVPGQGIDLKLSLVYNSRDLRTGYFGLGQSAPLVDTHIEWVFSGGGMVPTVFWGDGNRSFFETSTTSVLWNGVGSEFGKLKSLPIDAVDQKNGSHSEEYVVRKPNGMLYYFCKPTHYAGTNKYISWLNTIEDPNGNQIVIERDALGLPRKIIDSLGRNYEFEVNEMDRLITALVDPSGRRFDFHYDDPASQDSVSIAIGVLPPHHGTRPAPTPSVSQPISEDSVTNHVQRLVQIYLPETLYMNGEQIISSSRPYVSFTYQTSEDLQIAGNMTSIMRPSGVEVTFEYYDDLAADGYLFDRVKSHTIIDKVTAFSYVDHDEYFTDPYSQKVNHEAMITYPDGEVEHYFHDDDGLLIRHEVKTGPRDPQDFGAYVTIYSYNDDFQPSSKIVTTDVGFSSPHRRETTWSYDIENVDRFQQGNLLSVTELADGEHAYPGDSMTLSAMFTYEPFMNRTQKVTDTLQRESEYLFGYQELSLSDALEHPNVNGWEIAAPEALFDRDDLNGDGVGEGSMFGMVKNLSPPVVVESSDGPQSGLSPQKLQTLTQYNVVGQPIAIIDSAGIKSTIEYEGGLPIKSLSDVGGFDLLTRYTYDTLGRTTRVIYPDRRSDLILYDARDRVIEIRHRPVDDGTPLVEQFFFDLTGRVMGKVSPFSAGANSEQSYAVNARPRLIERTDYNQAHHATTRTQWIFDLTSGALKHKGTWSFEYDGRERVIKTTTPSLSESPSPSLITETLFNALGKPTILTRRDSNNAFLGKSEFHHNRYGNLVKQVAEEDSDGDGVNDTTTFVVDGFGRTRETIAPIGTRVVQTLDAAGRKVKEDVYASTGNTSPLSSTSTNYDHLDRVLSITAQDITVNFDDTVTVSGPESTITTGYDARGLPVWMKDAEDRLSRITYDALGRKTGALIGPGSADVEDNDLTGESFTLDAVGRVLERIVVSAESVQANALATPGANPLTSSWRFSYDSHGRMKSSTDPLGAKTTYRYNSLGLLTTLTDPLARTTSFHYDTAGRVWATHERAADGTTRQTNQTYDVKGNLLSLRDGEGNVTSYTYDSLGRQVSRIFPDGTAESFNYDMKGRLTSVNKAGGVTQQFLFDAADRVQQLSATGADADVYRHTLFDGLGRPRQISEQLAAPNTGYLISNVITQAVYSTHGIVEDRTLLGLGNTTVSYETKFDYNRNSRLVSLALPTSQRNITYEYDPLGRLAAVRNDTTAELIAQMSVPYGLGFLTANLKEGARLESDLDAAGRQLRREVVRSAGSGMTHLLGGLYRFDSVGNLTTRTSAIDSRLEMFRYDGLARLEEWRFGVSPHTAHDPVPHAERTVHWNHDRADNFTAVDDSTFGEFSPTINTLNQYTSFAPYAPIDFNERGEEVARIAGTKSVQWKWDSLGRPMKADVDPDGNAATPNSQNITFIHNGLNQLTAYSSGETATTYIHAGGALVASDIYAVGSGAPVVTTQRRYVPGPHGIWRSVNGAPGEYLHIDPFGNVEGIHDGEAALELYDYDPYGVPRSRTTGAEIDALTTGKNDLLFLGKPYHFELGLSRTDARFLDVTRGSFINRDPLGEDGGLNLYNYALSNPLRFNDASGLSPTETQEPCEDLPQLTLDTPLQIGDESSAYDLVAAVLERQAALQAQDAINGTNLANEYGEYVLAQMMAAGINPSVGGISETYDAALSPFHPPMPTSTLPEPGFWKSVGNFLDRTVVAGTIGAIEGIGIGLAITSDRIIGTTFGEAGVYDPYWDARSIEVSGFYATTGDVLSSLPRAPVKLGAETLSVIGEGVSHAITPRRVDEIHGQLDDIARQMRTTATVVAEDGTTLIVGGSRTLSPAQRAVLRPTELAARLPGAHAEMTVLNEVAISGRIPDFLQVSRPICQNCRFIIEEAGGLIGADGKSATFPKWAQ